MPANPPRKERIMADKENIPLPHNSGSRPPTVEPINNPIHISDRVIIFSLLLISTSIIQKTILP